MDSDGVMATKPFQNRTNKANRKTYAAKWNLVVLEGLKKALEKEPEKDLSTLLPPSYAQKLQSMKRLATMPNPTEPRLAFPDHDIRSRIDNHTPSEVVLGPSPELESLLQTHGSLSESIVNLITESEVLYEGVCAAAVMVFRLGKDMVVKFTREKFAINEYQSLAYVREALPDLPAPRPHGVIRLGTYGLLFTDFVPGSTLEKVWSQIDAEQKQIISHQLDGLFIKLRSLPMPENTLLGNVRGRGCIDGRRGIRTSSAPIRNVAEFEDWIFAGSKTASPVYTKLLRDLLPKPPAKCVFTHGDLRPANIIVERSTDAGEWRIRAVIDWEASGFYPEYWESIKTTNNLNPRDNCDWYNYLPASISPQSNPTQWLRDRLWDPCMVNC